MVTFDEFKKLEFKIGRIKEVSDHPNADRLYVVQVDMGEGTKQLVAGIKKSYEKEALIGKYVVVVDNLDTASLRGIDSYGMLLAASDEEGISVISPDRPVKLGSTVK